MYFKDKNENIWLSEQIDELPIEQIDDLGLHAVY